jgi:hypothetical protein
MVKLLLILSIPVATLSLLYYKVLSSVSPGPSLPQTIAGSQIETQVYVLRAAWAMVIQDQYEPMCFVLYVGR